jgi:hypothetical protein
MIRQYKVTWFGISETLDEDELTAYCMPLVVDEDAWDFTLTLDQILALDTDNTIEIVEVN